MKLGNYHLAILFADKDEILVVTILILFVHFYLVAAKLE